MEDLEKLLVDFQPLLKKLSNNPLKQFKNQKPTHLKLSREQKEELYYDFQVKFIELFNDFDETKGTPFHVYIGSRLGWYAHHQAEKLFEEFKYMVDIEDIEKIEYEEQEVYTEVDDEVSFYLNNCLDNLPPRQKEVIELLYFENLCAKEIAIKLGITEQSVYSNRRLALKKLRKIVKKPT